ncbi:hypothetical protein ACIRP3_25680 [Streptomyces sp. NPDC101209]|uniref:hypothetical protein n=1 Tax=Streptomyces sp. NPDC101209 TaxID=3366129 RepID=UPI00382B68B5
MDEIPPLQPAEDGAAEGPQVTGPHPRQWAWADLVGLEITEAPVRSAPQRWATHAASFVAAALDAWVPSSPNEMTLSVVASDGTYRTPLDSSLAWWPSTGTACLRARQPAGCPGRTTEEPT